MCNKRIICGVLFASGAITFYEGIYILSALAKYVINRLIHGLFHIALVINPRLISSLLCFYYKCKFGVISIKYVINANYPQGKKLRNF
jgi:hypothetical protein